MIFSSFSFFVFFLVYYSIHLALPARYRIYLIIVGSSIFYAWWKLEYFWIPYLLVAIAYYGTEWMERASNDRARRWCLTIVLIALFTPLVVLKYTDFLYRDGLGLIVAVSGNLLNFPLPLAISFVTFTLTAYIVDVFRRQFPISRSLPEMLGYVLFFPHLIAGPILRPIELFPQLRHPRWATWRRFIVALAIFSLGLVKKILFADQIGESVNQIYAQSGPLDAWSALVAIYGFGAQIYCDFSGYTDMAIGLALMLGVRLPNNFRQPYAASSLVDFWRRWHITLSSWLRDYLYIPLGGNQHGRLLTLRNVLITMLLGGLWHGASWTFVIWGLLHGLGISAVHLQRDLSSRYGFRPLPVWLSVFFTFQFVSLTWVFFRARTFDQAMAVLAAPFTGGWTISPAFLAANLFPIVLIIVLLSFHRYDDHRWVKVAVRKLRPEILWSILAMAWIVAITVSQGSSAAFIYFDF